MSGSTGKILASRRKRYTRSNPDPDLASPVENPESILRNQRYKDQSASTSIQRSKSLNTASDRVSKSVKVDIFSPPLHIAKSDIDLRECSEEVQQTRSSLWSLPIKRIKRKSVYSERTPSKFPKVSGEGQPVSYPLGFVPRKSGQLPLFPFQQATTMAYRYAPLVLLANLNPMPADYGTKIKQFGGEDDYTVRKHIQWFKDFCELNEIDHEDVQMRPFAQSLRDDVKEWFRDLTAGSINTI